MKYDVAIVGYGPAGITAGIYVARKKLSAIVIGELPGGEVVNSGEIGNWPGHQMIEGTALGASMVKHLSAHSGEVEIEQARVEKIVKEVGEFVLETDRGERYEAKTVIYAAGRHPLELGMPGEKEFKNLGVTYCATCDAPLFADKTVAVVGGGNTGAEAVIMLQPIAKKIYWLHLDESLTADAVLVERAKKDSETEIILSAKTVAITGEKMVTGLEYENVKTGDRKSVTVDGVFVSIGTVPNSELVADLVELDEYGAVVADRYGKTSVAGFFAAGDVTNTRDAQIVVAAGHGCSAALSAGEYLVRGK